MLTSESAKQSIKKIGKGTAAGSCRPSKEAGPGDLEMKDSNDGFQKKLTKRALINQIKKKKSERKKKKRDGSDQSVIFKIDKLPLDLKSQSVPRRPVRRKEREEK